MNTQNGNGISRDEELCNSITKQIGSADDSTSVSLVIASNCTDYLVDSFVEILSQKSLSKDEIMLSAQILAHLEVASLSFERIFDLIDESTNGEDDDSSPLLDPLILQ